MPKKIDEELNTWKGRIVRAEKTRKREEDRQGWERFIEEYQGKYRVGRIQEQIPIPPINIVYGYVHTEIPKLYFRDPYITVNAKGMQYIQRAKILEHVINYLFAELNIKHEIDKALLDTLLVGHGWIKYGYTGTFGEFTVSQEKVKGKKKEVVEEINEFIKNEEIFAVHVPWDDIVFDTMAKDPPYDCRWIAHSFIKPLEAIKDSNLYENTNGLKSNIQLKEGKPEDQVRESDLELIKLWEIWDKDTNKIMVLSDNHDKFLRNINNTYEMEGLPFSMLRFNRVPGKPYPLSDIFLIEPQILERIKLRAMQLNHVKRWARQLSVEKGSMEKEEMEKFMLGVDGSIILRNKGTNPPIPIQYAPLQAEIFSIDTLLQRDMDAVVGQTEVERGGSAKTETKTLGELQTQLVGSASRSSKRQDSIEDFSEEVARKLIQLLKQFQSTPKYVRITGKSPEEIKKELGDIDKVDITGLMFTREDIQGEFDVEAKAGSTIPINKQNRLKILESILQIMTGASQIVGAGPIKSTIKEILRDLDIKEAERAFDEEDARQKIVTQTLQSSSSIGTLQRGTTPLTPISPIVPGVRT